jgi:drug/metabolite transporter (DMT)-like permease
MNAHRHHDSPNSRLESQHRGHGGHGWMMIACCIPMLLIAVGLVAAGVASPGFILVAVACTAMMALMMRGMSHGDDDHH